MPTPNVEFITATRYYFNADRITEKAIQKIDSANVETPATEQIQGAVRGQLVRQAAPTAAKMGTIKLTLGLSKDTDIYQWYALANTNNNEANNWFIQGKRNATITAYNTQLQEVAVWDFTECYPTSYTLPDFTAGGNDIALEVVELVYTGIRRSK